MGFVVSEHTAAIAGRALLPGNEETGTAFRQQIEDMRYHRDKQLLCNSDITTIQALLLMPDPLTQSATLYIPQT